MPEKPSQRSGKGARTGTRGIAKTRRSEIRRLVTTRERMDWRDMVARPEFLPIAVALAGFIVLSSVAIGLYRGSVLVGVNRTMDSTREARIDFEVMDQEATQRDRASAADRAPWVYNANEALFNELRIAMGSLPQALGASESYEQVAEEIRDAFRLTAAQYQGIRRTTSTPEERAQWRSRVDTLINELQRTPLLENAEYQRLLQAPTSQMELRRVEMRATGDGEAEPEMRAQRISDSDAMAVTPDDASLRTAVEDRLRRIALRAGFVDAGADVVVQRLMSLRRPTYEFDKPATDVLRAQAAANTPPVREVWRRGTVLASAGERVNASTLRLLQDEKRRYDASVPLVRRAAEWLGILGLVSVLVIATAGYLRFYDAEMVQTPRRVIALSVFGVVMLWLACWLAVTYPALLWLATLGPVAFWWMMLAVAFDRRMTVLLGGLLALLVALALDRSAGFLITAMVGAAAAAWRMNDIRSRNELVRGGLVVAGALAVSAVLTGLIERPMSQAVLIETLSDGAAAGVGGFIAAAMVLVGLPLVERSFDVTTGLTLSDLRDPRHPLLRKLQQRAPGTYHHSLNVATLAEAAANEIGADGLHLYVGALYHDIGKMNKPDYFVENQPRGFNKHDRLSPAMSLLVIVGHVKDGIELAREYGLPRSLHQYIESHHGTTLVEYFFDKAKRDASTEEKPTEIEYRYPGPKPQRKEAAILMLCDAVESATRAMAEPTPSRIQALVHSIARKRLADGQFDECELTLRELSLIEDAITRMLSAIYHGRIAYPKSVTER
ncbi:MAG: HDIG domain-containing protein, partial [Phycisphaeraceae bacterium]